MKLNINSIRELAINEISVEHGAQLEYFLQQEEQQEQQEQQQQQQEKTNNNT